MKTTTKNVKAATKGQKQIVTDNEVTLRFYRNMVFAASAIYFIGLMLFSTISTADYTLIFFATCVYIGCYQFMVFMARNKFSESGQLLDSGVDLNMEGGISEHIKDIIILTCACQVLSLYSNSFWLLWLAIPGRGFWLLWKNILSPYFFQQVPPENPELDDKKQKKLDRKLKRQNR